MGSARVICILGVLFASYIFKINNTSLNGRFDSARSISPYTSSYNTGTGSVSLEDPTDSFSESSGSLSRGRDLRFLRGCVTPYDTSSEEGLTPRGRCKSVFLGKVAESFRVSESSLVDREVSDPVSDLALKSYELLDLAQHPLDPVFEVPLMDMRLLTRRYVSEILPLFRWVELSNDLGSSRVDLPGAELLKLQTLVTLYVASLQSECNVEPSTLIQQVLVEGLKVDYAVVEEEVGHPKVALGLLIVITILMVGCIFTLYGLDVE